MVFSEMFERFVEERPACVMYRALLENVFSPNRLDALFRGAAEVQYERELLFSTVVDAVGQVVCRISKSVRAAYIDQRDRISVSLRAFYDKLSGIETGTSRALVRETASRIAKLIDRTKGRRKPLLAGYRIRILDGNHIGKTHHRLGVLRKTAAGALPGQALAILDPDRMIIEDVIPCEDGHAQERTMLDQVLNVLEKGDLLIDDRNFCTVAFLFAVKQSKAYFITRQHGNMPYKLVGKRRYIGRGDTGRVYEQLIEIQHPLTKKTTQIRRITVHLKSPTRDGDEEIHLLSNLPASKVSAVKVAALYRKRWTLEQAFNELTVYLRCELNTLGYPKAALFAFCVAVCSYNLLAAVKGALRGVHGEKIVDEEVSNYYLTNEINTTYGGMMIALPPEEWSEFQTTSTAKLATYLRRWSRIADLTRYPKQTRGPKKPKAKLPNAQFQHVSTAKLLDQQRSERNTKRKKKPEKLRP